MTFVHAVHDDVSASPVFGQKCDILQRQLRLVKHSGT